MKKTLSVLLCLAIVFSAVAMCLPVSAATAGDDVGYNRKTSVSSADQFSWDNASVYFLLTDRFYNGDTSNDHAYGKATDSSGNALPGWNTNPVPSTAATSWD